MLLTSFSSSALTYRVLLPVNPEILVFWLLLTSTISGSSPLLVQIDASAVCSIASVNATGVVPSVRALVPSPAGLAPPATTFATLVFSQASTLAHLAGVAPTVPTARAWFESRMVSMSRLRDLPFLAT